MSYAMHTPNQGYPNMTTDAYGRSPYGMITPNQGYYPPSELYGGQHYPPPLPSQGPPPPPHPQSYLPPPSPMPQGSSAMQANYPPPPPPPHAQHAHAASLQHYQEAMHYGYGASARAHQGPPGQLSQSAALSQHSLQQAAAAAGGMISGQQLPPSSAYHTTQGPQPTTSQSNRLSSKAVAAAQYWASSCDPTSQAHSSPTGHCYGGPPPPQSSHKSSPVTTSSAGWPTHPSPHSMTLNSPSSTPSPASTPQHHSFGGSSSSGSAQSQLASSDLKAVYGLDAVVSAGRSKQNPLLSLQKMVQIEQQQQLQQQGPPSHGTGEVQYDANGNPLPPPLTLDPSDPAYPTYYNLDQANFPPTPYSPSIPSKASPEMVRSSSQLGQASVGSCSGSVKHESGSENGDSSQQQQQQPSTCHRRSYSTSKPKPEEAFMRSGSSETCSNSPPLQPGNGTVVGQMSHSQAGPPSTGSGPTAEQMRLTPSGDLPLPVAEQTRDSAGSYRGSEMTVGSRDSVKSSDSGDNVPPCSNAPFAGVNMSSYGQLSQNNSGSWKSDGSGRRSLDDYSVGPGSGQRSQAQQSSSSSKWWPNMEGSPSSQGNSAQFESYYSGHQMAAHSSEWSSNSGGLVSNRQQQQQQQQQSHQPQAPAQQQQRGPRKYRTKNSIAAAAALASSTGGNSSSISSPGSSGQLVPGSIGPDGEIIVVKKKRGRPFGSKNKRSLEAAAAAAAVATINNSTGGNNTTPGSLASIGGAILSSTNNSNASSSNNNHNQNNNNSSSSTILSAAEQSKQARKRRPTVVDANTNTSLSFDIPNSYLLTDIEAFVAINPDAVAESFRSNSTVHDEDCISLLQPQQQSHFGSKRHHQQQVEGEEQHDESATHQQQQQSSQQTRESEELSLLQTMSSKRRRTGGPVVRVEKCSKTQATKYSIVNLNREEESDSKSKNSVSQRIPLLTGSRKSSSNGLSSSHHRKSHSSGHNMNGHDKSSTNWICILCHKGPNHKGLGDLFGPYSIQVDRTKLPANFDIEWLDADTNDHSQHSHNNSHSNEHDTVNSSTATNSGTTTTSSMNASSATTTTTTTTPPTSERRSLRRRPESASSHHEERSSRSSSHKDSTDHEQSGLKNYDVWVHEDCIVWSNSVYIDACTKIRNLEPAIVESFSYICTKCKLPGATLGCLYKNCSITPLHYLCAKEKDCDLDEENFVLSCPKHKKQRMTIPRNRMEHSEPAITIPSKSTPSSTIQTPSINAGSASITTPTPDEKHQNQNGTNETLPELMTIAESEERLNSTMDGDSSSGIDEDSKQNPQPTATDPMCDSPLSPSALNSSSPLAIQNTANTTTTTTTAALSADN